MTNTQGNVMTKDEWDAFVKGDLLNFMVSHNIQKAQMDDGAGKKGVIRCNASGEYIVQITSKETM